LLADTPYDVITCSVCGSKFSLVDRHDATRLATPLNNIGRFQLIARLGVGAFGTVWKARDVDLDRVVAVKIPRKGQLSALDIEQFFREARAAAQLRHPNIVAVHEVGREGDTVFIVCDLVRGVELSDWLTAVRPSSRESVAVCLKIALALEHAHRHGIIHRDLKPSNVMVDDDGEPRIMDFGLAKRDAEEITMTVDGQILGTPAYMSPEQAGGQSHWTDRRTDVYSLGVILFRMLTGDLPFRGNAQMQVFQRLKLDPPDPRTLNRNIPRDVATICLKCLERDPNRRYASASALADDCARFLEGRPIVARPISRSARLVRWARRRPALATAAVLAAVLAVGGPLAALVIDGQRRQLSELVDAQNRMIDRYAVDQQKAAGEINRLSGQLAVWEGGANPWELWPPAANEPPRRQLLEDLYEQRYQAVDQDLRSGQYNDLQRIHGHLALAMLADGPKRRDAAREHLREAQKLLAAPAEGLSDKQATLRALADCYERLAQLEGDGPTPDGERYLREASRIYAQLADGPGANRHRADRFEAELRRAVAAGRADAVEPLQEATLVRSQLAEHWPRDPVELYDVVCRLHRQEPLLASPPLTGK
jgi:tRNA A-37 threonylcarbamoyl transferase component Bud32